MPDTRLIERWLPISALGIESTRERTPMTPFPAPNRLHVWWARRPLVASRAAVLASLLPADADRERFLHVYRHSRGSGRFPAICAHRQREIERESVSGGGCLRVLPAGIRLLADRCRREGLAPRAKRDSSPADRWLFSIRQPVAGAFRWRPTRLGHFEAVLPMT